MKNMIRKIIRPVNKYSALLNLEPRRVLLVGCGNGELDALNSFYKCEMIGIDIEKSNAIYLNNEVITTPAKFHKTILRQAGKFDLIISSHNIEHCNFPVRTLLAMCEKLNTNGQIYLAWPSPSTEFFPKRNGTLNFYDDQTHKNILHPNLIEKILQKKQISIIKNIDGYKPKVGFIIGMMLEPISIIFNRAFSFTWDYYGFEAIIIGRKN